MSAKTNVLLIFTDQHRRDMLTCYGNSITRTPATSRLARDGAVFENAYCTHPVCTPARASLQTGLYPCGHGMQSNLFCPGCIVHELPDTPELLSRRLQEAGYSAGHTGKWHLGYGRDAYEDPAFEEMDVESCVLNVMLPDAYRQASSLPSDLGYEGDDFPGHGGGGHGYPQYKEYLRENGIEHRLKKHFPGCAEVVSEPESTIDHFLTNRAINWIDEFRQREQPFFFGLHFWGPHGPAYVPSEFFEPYRDLRLSPWPNFVDDRTRKPRIHDVTRAHQGADDWATFEPHVRFAMAYNDYVDYQIGRLLQHLDETGLYDETCIIFAADHGDSLGCHGGLVNKAYHLYEETATIPLLIKPAGSRDRQLRVQAFANTTDIYSTILDAAGVPEELHRRHGRSLLPLANGETPIDWPETVVAECTSVAYLQFTQRMIRSGDLKYTWNCGDIDELYDLAADPCELINLAEAPEYATVAKEMRQRLVGWLREKNDPLVRYHWNVFTDF